MEAIWEETMEAAEEISAHGQHYFCSDSLLCWIINELLAAVWTCRELVWWNILALYIHRFAKKIHSVGFWMLAFVWLCLRLSADENWLEITHPAERAIFIFSITNPIFEDLHIACILLVKLDFLASVWESRHSLGQLPTAVSNLFTLKVDFEIPVSTAWVQGYIPARSGSLSDAETLQLLAEDAKRQNRGHNSIQSESPGADSSDTGTPSLEVIQNNTWGRRHSGRRLGGLIAIRRNQRCECEPCHCINRAEAPKRKETCDRGTQTDVDYSGRRGWSTNEFLPFKTQPVCPCSPCQCNKINNAPKPLSDDENNSAAPEDAEETDTDAVEEEEPCNETTPGAETTPVTVIPVIDLTDESQPVRENWMARRRIRSTSPLDPRIPTIRYKTRHGREIPEEPEFPDVPEVTNDTQEVANYAPIDNPPSEPKVPTNILHPRASTAASPLPIFQWPTKPEVPESQGDLNVANNSQVLNQPDMFAHLRNSIRTADPPAARPLPIFQWPTSPEVPKSQGGLEVSNGSQVHNQPDIPSVLPGRIRPVEPPASDFMFGFELMPVPQFPELRSRLEAVNDNQAYEHPDMPVLLPDPVPTVNSPEESCVHESRSLSDTDDSLWNGNSSNMPTSAEVESHDIDVSGIKEVADQQDSARHAAQPDYPPGIDYYDIDYTPDFSIIPPLPDSPLDSATREADYFCDPPVLSELPPLPDSPQTPFTSLPIRLRISEMFQSSHKHNSLKDRIINPEDIRGAPDNEGASETKDNEVTVRETTPTAPYEGSDSELSDPDLYGWSDDNLTPPRQTTPIAPYEGSDPELSDPDLYGCSDNDKPDGNEPSGRNPRETTRPVSTVVDFGSYRDGGDNTDGDSGDEAPPNAATTAESRAKISKLDVALDDILGAAEAKARSQDGSGLVPEHESDPEQPYEREGSPMESVHSRESSPMDCDSEGDHSVSDIDMDIPGEALQIADIEMVDSPSTQTQGFGYLDSIFNAAQMMPPFTTLAEEFQQTAQAQCSETFQDSNNGPRFTNMMDQIQGTDHSPSPAQALSSPAQTPIPGLTLTNPPAQSEAQRPDYLPSPEDRVLNILGPFVNSLDPASVPDQSFHNTPMSENIERMEIQVPDTPTDRRPKRDREGMKKVEVVKEEDIGNSVPVFDVNAMRYHACLNQMAPLPTRQPPATETSSEHSEDDDPNDDTEPAPPSPEETKFSHDGPELSKESTQEEIAARPKLKLRPRFHRSQLPNPAAPAGPSQQPNAEIEHEEEQRDPELPNNDTQAGHSQQPDANKEDEEGEGKADEDVKTLPWETQQALMQEEFDRLDSLGVWEIPPDDGPLEPFGLTAHEAHHGFRDPTSPTPAPRPQPNRGESEASRDQQDITPDVGISEEDWKPYEQEFVD
ncbi:hypothetical protein EDB81DRAFT_880656 [Dactylonectria macrodidyma]|uniref:Uncharacterized protein n=1 Tax=Dactylonectria macrodidyma TaxID=307937 RepID=A0A9P9JFP2_9HYPO|nr:hypothetical protein EDB81DRAFT_880656 [Dactylonectria macrodidyma]